MVQQQAAVLAYIDDFRILAVLCALCVPAGFLFKKVLNAKPVAGATLMQKGRPLRARPFANQIELAKIFRAVCSERGLQVFSSAL